MLSLFYCFVVIFVVCAIVFVIWYFTNYKDAKSGCVSKITFNRFRAFYYINPHNWNTDRPLYVSYNPTNSRGISYMYHFYFPVFDTLRYYIWRKKNKASIENAYNLKMMENVIKFWRYDIQKYCEDNGIPIKELEDPEQVGLSSGYDMQRGDVVLNDSAHTGILSAREKYI